ncbi:acrosin-like [Amphibalanus amphitrite]|uniref:acrosin-like n=1 Tax=Amphibalanus amphitrite TaxID=1232801 RepID=UPI001C8FFA6E|nr:acrosin-like [Amphibalanus amphitrite]XP_043205616.1 acrosin-like [Amphibalanus amphitrite]
MGDVPDLPPTSLSKAIKEGGEVFASWLNHQTLLSVPREYPPPPDTRVPWNKSHMGMPDNNGPSFARIYYIARPKKVIGMEVHTRTNDEVLHVPKAALKYNITDHVLMMSHPKKVHPPDVNEPWHLKNKGKKYHLPERVAIIARPRKVYPSTDRPASEIGHPPRAALYGHPPRRGDSAPAKKAAPPPPKPAPPPPPPPPAAAEPAAPSASTTGPTTTTSSTEPTGTTSTTGGPTTSGSSSGVTSSSSGSSGAGGGSESSPSADT